MGEGWEEQIGEEGGKREPKKERKGRKGGGGDKEEASKNLPARPPTPNFFVKGGGPAA